MIFEFTITLVVIAVFAFILIWIWDKATVRRLRKKYDEN